MASSAASLHGGVAKEYATKAIHELLSAFRGEVALADVTGLAEKTESSFKPAAVVAGGSSGDFAYGSLLSRIIARQRLADDVSEVLEAGKTGKTLTATLKAWLASKEDRASCAKALEFADQWLVREGAFEASIDGLYRRRSLLPKLSNWIVVPDGWDIGTDLSGIHSVLASSEDINVLVLCSDPDPSAAFKSSEGAASAALTHSPHAHAHTAQPRKDIGLYALNYGTAYVASTSPAVDPAQFSKALAEADAFKGPSIVLAYIPAQPSASAHAGAHASASPSTPVRHFASSLSSPDKPSVPAYLYRLEEAKESKSEDGVGAHGGAHAIAVAREAVEAGRWPLYRWDPSLVPTEAEGHAVGGEVVNPADGVPQFRVDSAKVRADLASFLDRERSLALLARTEPALHPALTHSLEAHATAQTAAAASALKAQFEALMGALTKPPLLVLFGSDGGNAEAVARRVASEARARGYSEVTCKAMDAVAPTTLATAPLAVFVVSTAGQGEMPQNARNFYKGLTSHAVHLANLSFAVFGLGDSNYWPRKEQRIFFNKASVDLDATLASLGAARLVERGVGDDQSVGGYNADFRAWVPALWQALGVGSPTDDGSEGAPKVRGNEAIKATSNGLRGTIAQGLLDTSTGAISYEDGQLTKFHGIYQQDDRDARADRKKAGLEPAYSFMVRVRVPGGVATPAQYLALDAIADSHANGTLRVTTRQAIQFHGIIKGKLKPAIAGINKSLMDTLAACGDVNRNVMCALPYEGEGTTLHAKVLEFSRKLSDYLSPRTTAYAEIWLDDKLVKSSESDVEPIYGPTYLPRKFKIAVAVPPSNDVDIFANDLGFVAVATADGRDLAGFTVTIGGGMGMSHGNTKTYPRTATDLCYATPEQALAIAEAVVTTQRDFGDRSNRKHARMKYTVDDMGMEAWRAEVGKRVGYTLTPPKPYVFTSNGDQLGWHQGADGTWCYNFFIQNGRIKDSGSYRLKSGLKALAQVCAEAGAGHFILTPNQNTAVAKVPGHMKARLHGIMEEYGILNTEMSGLRLNSMACVALPTCALALAESERYLPSLLDKLDVLVTEAGLRDDAITIRMTGCPNGCARPYIAEIGFVGRSPGIYNLYLGAGFHGQRLSKLYKEGVDEEQIIESLKPIIKQYSLERKSGEHFGDFCVRAGIIKATVNGLDFHDQ